MSTRDAAASPLDLAHERTDMASLRTREALVRTRLAYERTLMAWVRTAMSMISFGFTIYKFFEYMRDGQARQPERWLEPRGVALVMIALGVGALLMATLEHRRDMKALQADYVSFGPLPRSLAAAVSGVVTGLGILGFVLVFLRQ